MSQAARLQAYRDSVPLVKKNCAHCGSEFETKFGMYCSTLCKSRASRSKKKQEAAKDLLCFYCGCQITKKSHYKFCCEDHGNKFQKAKERGKPIILRINKALIQTKKYDSIPAVIKHYQEVLSKKI